MMPFYSSMFSMYSVVDDRSKQKLKDITQVRESLLERICLRVGMALEIFFGK
jgi:hypothetical protein